MTDEVDSCEDDAAAEYTYEDVKIEEKENDKGEKEAAEALFVKDKAKTNKWLALPSDI